LFTEARRPATRCTLGCSPAPIAIWVRSRVSQGSSCENEMKSVTSGDPEITK
jgi:hypothetical protein